MSVEKSVPIRLLLVSCHIQTIEILCQLIQKMAVDVETCCDFAGAMQKLLHAQFEGVIADLDDEECGLELLGKLRTSDSHKGVVSYAILSNPAQKTVAFRAGANFVFERPLLSGLVGRTLAVSYPLLVRERRRYFRCPMHTRIYVKRESHGEFAATSVNVSESGIAIVSPMLLQDGERVQLRLQLPGNSDFVMMTGEVSWANQTGRAGIRFTKLTSGVSEQLHTWLSTRLQDTLNTIPMTSADTSA